MGEKWRVGNGSRIDVRHEFWVTGFKDGLVQTLGDQPPTPLKVSFLIKDDGRWNKEQLENWFNPNMVQRIVDIPLSSPLGTDRLIWSDSPIGPLTVRSAYYKARELLNREGRGDTIAKPLWTMIWHSNMAPKIKFFMWSLCNDILPVMSNLLAKGMKAISDCCICAQSQENLCLVFFSCEFSKQV